MIQNKKQNTSNIFVLEKPMFFSKPRLPNDENLMKKAGFLGVQS